MHDLNKKLEELLKETDGGKLLAELSTLLNEEVISSQVSPDPQKHLNKLLTKITKHLEELEKNKQESQDTIEAVQKLSDACLAYTKTKTER
jgi:uncharacterized protein YciW